MVKEKARVLTLGDQKFSDGSLPNPDQVVKGLVRELKNPLLFIARQAEYSAKNANPSDIETIQNSAEQALKLIDSYLLSAQSEYGQKRLELSPINIGSIFYDVAHSIDAEAKKYGYQVEVSCKYNHPVMADKKAAISSLSCLSQILLMPGEGKKIIRLSSFKRSSGQVLAGVLVNNANGLKNTEIDKALNLQGDSAVAMSSGANVSGVQLALANNLAKAMGGQILPVKYRRLKGLGLELTKSEQMALV